MYVTHMTIIDKERFTAERRARHEDSGNSLIISTSRAIAHETRSLGEYTC